MHDPHGLGKQLIDEFFEALDTNRQFGRADEIIEQLRSFETEQSFFTLWADYFSGILAEERDRDWAAVEQYYLKVLSANPETALKAQVLLSLGIAYDKQARWHESIEICEKSIKQWELAGNQIKKSLAQRQIAITYCNGFDMGDYEQIQLDAAKIHCQQAVDTFRSFHKDTDNQNLNGSNLAFYSAATLEVLGRIYSCSGEYEQAIEHFKDSLNIYNTNNLDYHRGFVYKSLGDAYQLSGTDHSMALTFYEKALSCFQEHNERYFEFYVLAHQGVLLRKLRRYDESLGCFQKSLAMLETVRAGISSEAARSGYFSTVVNIYANAILTQLEADHSVDAFNYSEQSRSRAFWDSLVTITDDLSDRTIVDTVTFETLRDLVPADCLILEFFTTGLTWTRSHSVPNYQNSRSVLFPEAITFLFAITQENFEVYNVGLSPNALLPRQPDMAVEQCFLDSQIRQALYTKLIAPIAHLLKNKRRLYIIPHGPLHYVPFHALIAPDGETLLREDGPEIVYAPSATILFRELQKPDRLPPGTCLAVGYNGDAGMELHFAEEEATYIARMAGGRALVGPSAKKAALYAQAPNFQALHFSCHGEFDPDSPLESLLHIGPSETLTGQEIMDNLHLQCNLVTLSACESGLSKVQRGDELYGLIRAFMYAGAPAIIATLWRVDERSTLIFAEKFYELEQQEVPYATAVKAAQLYLKNLTRKEALAILTKHLAQTAPVNSTPLLLQAQQYLKSFATREALRDGAHTVADLLPGADDDEKIFADPKYWAPFVLVGDPQLQRP